MDICKCGHPLEDHAGHAPHYCHADCECNAYIQADPADRITSAERAVIEAAVEESIWRRQIDLQRPDIIACTLDGLVHAERAVLAAVDALLAAREGR